MKHLFVILALLCVVGSRSYACTTVIVAAQKSATGRPILWKNRDTNSEFNHLKYFEGGKYSFTGLIDASAQAGKESVYAGANEAGLVITNNLSYNVHPEQENELASQNGKFIKACLENCVSLAEVEKFIETSPFITRANLAVIDAYGGAAYYELWNQTYTKYDVANSEEGYMVRTNFSFESRQPGLIGLERYKTISALTKEQVQKNKLFDVQFFEDVAKLFRNDVLKVDYSVKRTVPKGGWIVDQDFIPRFSSSASIVIEGVNKPEDANEITLWCASGYPPCTYAVPVWVGAKSNIPSFLTAAPGQTAEVSTVSYQLKHQVFPYKESNGEKYLNYKLLSSKIMPAVSKYEAIERKQGSLVQKGQLSSSAISAYNKGAEERFQQFKTELSFLLNE